MLCFVKKIEIGIEDINCNLIFKSFIKLNILL